MVRSNPCHDTAKLPEESGACPRLSPADEEKLMRECAVGPAYLAPLVTFALGTGMRRAEMLSLKWRDVDFARGLLFVLKTKWAKDPRKDKGPPFGSRVRETLMSLPRRGEFVFTTDRSRDVPGTTFHQDFHAACARAGLRFKIHRLRHEFGSRLG